MKNLALLVCVLAASCKGDKKADPAPAPAPAPPAPSGSAVAPAPAPATTAGFDAGRVGALTRGTALEVDVIRPLFPDATVQKTTEEGGEGETYELVTVKRGASTLFTVVPEMREASIQDPALRDPRGIGLGSTYKELAAAYPDVSCERFISEGGEEGMGPADTVTCKAASMNGVEYFFDIIDAKQPGDLPAAKAADAAGAKIEMISVDL